MEHFMNPPPLHSDGMYSFCPCTPRRIPKQYSLCSHSNPGPLTLPASAGLLFQHHTWPALASTLLQVSLCWSDSTTPSSAKGTWVLPRGAPGCPPLECISLNLGTIPETESKGETGNSSSFVCYNATSFLETSITGYSLFLMTRLEY